MRFPFALGLMLVLSSACGHHVFVPDRAAGFISSQLNGDRYHVYVPKDWSADRAWPVIVYLHGSGERGSDGIAPTQTGIGPVAWKSQGSFPFVIVFPQAPRGSYWGMPENNKRVLAMLDDVMSRYHGDPDRVILTGNSLGGFGTWFLGALEAERFAAFVPICGGVRGRAPRPDAPMAKIAENDRAAEVARRIGKKPVWIFHGAKDPLVPVKYSRELAQALKDAGGDVRFTEYPGVGHNSWDRAYAEPELMKWLETVSRKK